MSGQPLSRQAVIEIIRRIWFDDIPHKDIPVHTKHLAESLGIPHQYVVGAVHFAEDVDDPEEVADRLLELTGQDFS